MKPCARRQRAASGDCSARAALDTRSRERPQPRGSSAGRAGPAAPFPNYGLGARRRTNGVVPATAGAAEGGLVASPGPGSGGWCPPSLPAPSGGGQLPAAIPSVRRSPPFTGGAGALPAGQLWGAEVKVCKIASLRTGAGLSHRRNTARSPERRTEPGAAPPAGPSTYRCAK